LPEKAITWVHSLIDSILFSLSTIFVFHLNQLDQARQRFCQFIFSLVNFMIAIG
jgi:hypothetical protein